MTVTVWIPPLLRRHTAGREEMQVEGRTVAEALRGLGTAGAEALSLLHDDADRAVSVFLNGQRVETSDGLRQDVRSGDEIALVPRIVGGW